MENIFEVDRVNVLEAIDDLESLLLTFKSALLNDTDAKVLCLYQIPLRSSTELKDQTEVIDVTHSEDAMKLAACTLTSIYLAPGQNPRESIRTPGIIQCSADVIDLAREVCQAKSKLITLIDQVDARKRRQIYRLRKSIHAMQMRRMPEILDRQCSTARIFWDVSPGVSRIRAKEQKEYWLDLLRDLRNDSSVSMSNLPNCDQTLGEVEYGIVQDLSSLAQVADEEVLAKVKFRTPHVITWLGFKGQEEGPSELSVTGSMPVLIANDKPAPRISDALETLMNNDLENHKAGRRLLPEPVTKGQNIYRYREAYRDFFSEPVVTKKTKRKLSIVSEGDE